MNEQGFKRLAIQMGYQGADLEGALAFFRGYRQEQDERERTGLSKPITPAHERHQLEYLLRLGL